VENAGNNDTVPITVRRGVGIRHGGLQPL